MQEQKEKLKGLFNGRIRDHLQDTGAKALDFKPFIAILTDAIKTAGLEKLITPDMKATVISIIEDLFEDYVRPFDIPFVPNLIVEPMLDNWIKSAIPGIVDRVFDRFVAA